MSKIVPPHRPAYETAHLTTKERTPMKYMLLIYQNPANWQELPDGERDAIMSERRRDHGGAHGVRRVGRRRGAGRPVAGQDGARARRRPGGHRRAVRRGQGAPRPATCIVECETPERAVEIAARWPDARYSAVEVRPLMDTRRARRCERPTTATRTCCASWRRRSSARSSAATGTSTRARTRCRRRCSRPPSQWPREGVPDNPRGWLITVALAPADRPAAQRAGAPAPRGHGRRSAPPTSSRRRRRRRRRRATTR